MEPHTQGGENKRSESGSAKVDSRRGSGGLRLYNINTAEVEQRVNSWNTELVFGSST